MTEEINGNYFAIRPLSTRLVSMTGVPVRAYESGKGLVAPKSKDFQSIDLEAWARQFLEAMDDFLFSLPRDFRDEWEREHETDEGSLYVVGAPVEERTGGLWPEVRRVASACAEVAWAAAEGVDYLIQATDDPEELERVKKGVRRALLRRLSAGYATDTVFESQAVLLYARGTPDSRMRAEPSDAGGEGIPLALRSCPSPPSLVGQLGVPAHPDASDIDKALLWNYVFDLEHRSEDQDALYVTISTGPREGCASPSYAAPRISPLRVDEQPPLASALAAFVEAYPAIRQDLPVPLKPDDKDTAAAGPAVMALAELAEAVSRGWKTFWQGTSQHLGAAADDPAAQEGASTFRLEKRYAQHEGSRVLDAVELSVVGDAAKPPERWPSLSLPSPDGEYPALTREPAGDRTSVYTCKGLSFESDGSLIRFGLEELDVLREWWVVASAGTARNENLDGNPAVNEAFVYRTPMVAFYNALMPMIVQSQPIAMEQPTDDLAASLSGFLSKLFGEEAAKEAAKPSLKITVTYRQVLKEDAVEGEGGLAVVLPVLLTPPLSYDKELGKRLAGAVREWWKEKAPGEPGHFELGVEVFPEAREEPSLYLERVVFSLRE